MIKLIIIFTVFFFTSTLWADTIDIQISKKLQDVEERISNGKILDNGTLDMVFEYKKREEYVGLQFKDLPIPEGSTINASWITFVARNAHSGITNLVIEIEQSTNSVPLSRTVYDLSSRTMSPTVVNWNNIPAWTKNVSYESNDLSTLLQGIVNQAGWYYNNDILIRVKAGNSCTTRACRRQAHSYNSDASKAPVLHVDFTPPPLDVLVDYRMDECYFLGGAYGIEDVLDSSTPNYDAQSSSRVDSNNTDAKICRAGAFNDNSYATVTPALQLTDRWSLSVWLNFPFVQSGKQYYILGSYTGVGDFPVFEYQNNTTLRWGIYDNTGALQWNSIDNSLSGWHHLVFTNTLGTTTLYIDGEITNSVALSTKGDLSYLWTSSDNVGGQSIASNLDEMKIFSQVLTAVQISSIYVNEDLGNNYDGSTRDCPSCDSTTIDAHSWELVSIPADLASDSKTVADIFGNDMNGTFNTDWRVYQREYSDTNNSSKDVHLSNLTDPLEFGQGYWLGSRNASRWGVSGTTPVNYNYSGTGCPSGECVLIDLKSTNLDASATPADDLLGTGPNRYNLSGFSGLRQPVDWADCRFLIDGQAFTPSDANNSAYVSRTIWLYNASSKDYATCDDTMVCKLIPFKGFWIELHGKTKGKTVQLSIPKQ